jgi:N-acetylglucosaminyl-diphospho-decaprenol L-rhamnosyltransferase
VASSYAVVVLYFRRGPQVIETIQSLLGQSLPPMEVILVDNASGDGVLASLPSLSQKPVRVISADSNLGYSAGMALGASEIKGNPSWVLFVTHEVILDPDAIEVLIREGQQANAAQIAPVTRLRDSNEAWSVGGSFNSRGNTKHQTLPASPPPSSTLSAAWLEGCCHLIRRDLLTSSLFDPRYFVYWDDVDISWSLKPFGPVLVALQAHAWQTTGTTPIYFSARNRILFWRKNANWSHVGWAVLEPLAKGLLDLGRRDWTRARIRFLAIQDGFSGRLRLDLASVRERGVTHSHA